MNWAVEMLAATTLLMLVVLLVRHPVAKAFGSRAAYALWLVPLARVVLPTMPIEMPAARSGPAGPDVVSVAVTQAAAAPALLDVALFLWLGGALLFLAWHAFAYRRFIADALAKGRSIAVPWITDSAVIATAAVTGPAATGILIRRIFVPQDFERRFSREEQELALAHEALHHRRGDLWASTAALAMLALHWFNPIAHVAHRAFRRDLEAACDATLLQSRGNDARPAYARTILRCAGQPMPQTSCPLTPIGELKGRLEMLTHNHGTARRLAGFLLAGTLAAAGLAVAQPVAAKQEAKEEATERTEIRRVVVDKNGNHLRRGLPDDLRERMAKCDGEKFESEVAGEPVDGKKPRNKILICAKAGSTKAETAVALEKVLNRLEGDSEMPAENKAQIVARLKARIAELKAGG